MGDRSFSGPAVDIPAVDIAAVPGYESRVRVALANDYVVVVAGLAALLQPFADRVEIVDWLLFDLADGPPVATHGDIDPVMVDIVLFDTFGRPGLGLGALEELLVHPRARRVVLYTGDTDRNRIANALKLGAAGVLDKSLDGAALVHALGCIAAGATVVKLGNQPNKSNQPNQPTTPAVWGSDWPGHGWGLTEREGEVLALLTRGLRNREIAEALYLSVDTVKSHVKSVYRKLGVPNRAAAVSAGLVTGEKNMQKIR